MLEVITQRVCKRDGRESGTLAAHVGKNRGAIDFHRIICKIEQHFRRVSTDVIACPQLVAIDSSPGVGFVFSDLYDVFFRELIVSIFNRHLFSMSCH